jgi:hypothetical protein
MVAEFLLDCFRRRMALLAEPLFVQSKAAAAGADRVLVMDKFEQKGTLSSSPFP